ncbi:ATP-grasp fold amidoligase family protein [Vannielia litorea]|uniref:TupA-like ATPgrasp n=1 Tax=Vannielia litorea TaxID=1217970 RepID=A0A1N6E7P8_9RHOB|nr:ATP-grasp fold amidoligase family protein [Vannielia litorea]SIN79044.1 TupA-like ATPgrasp [Vannielia litorea]
MTLASPVPDLHQPAPAQRELRPQSRADAALFAAVEAWARLRHGKALRWLRKTEGAPRRQSVALPDCANDKFTWRKLFDHDPRFVQLSDKATQRDWPGAARCGVPWVPMLWVGDDIAAFPDALFARDIILKGAHCSGRTIFAEAGTLTREALHARTRRTLRRTHGRKAAEWAYRHLPHRILAEPMLGSSEAVTDIKFYTYGGQIERVIHLSDRRGKLGRSEWLWRDGTFRRLPGPPQPGFSDLRAELPDITWRAMETAQDLGAHFDHVRVDFLSDGQGLWLGELTFYTNAGFYHGDLGTSPAAPTNRMWDLRRSWFMQSPQRGWREAYRRALARSLEAAAAT